jgi:hypothetical protein
MRQLLLLLVFACVLASPNALAGPQHKNAQQTAAQVHADAMQLAHRALKAFLQRDFVAATELYGSAARLEPEVAEFAFGEARSLQERGLIAAAKPIFARVVALTPPEHPLHGKATAALIALQPPPPSVVLLPAVATPVTIDALPVVVAAPFAMKPVSFEASQVVASQPPAHSSWRRPAGYGTLALGVALAAVGSGLAVSAAYRQSALDDHKMPDGRYDLTQVSYDTAVNEQRSINSRWTWATVAGGVGVTAIATAIWWLVTEPAEEPQRLGARGTHD